MKGPFWKFEEEHRKKMLYLGAKVYVLFKAGKSVEEIAKETGLSRELVEHCIKDEV
ncbi:hypothetical protein U8V72_24670 [Priestia filamentosa]|uniref:hypothetical protein n=1 Tax=Priestia filamentosa TaxID=1402861 RepID=UPI00397B6514